MSEQEGMVNIDVTGRFDFSLQKDFRATYRNCPPTMKYRVNLNMVDYLDSAALGMLLLLRQHAGEGTGNVTLCKAPAEVSKILKLASFDRLFRIE
jgi:anti-anti-sigma factor